MKKIIIYNSCFILILLIFTEFLTGNYLFNKSKIDCVYLQCGQKLVFENVNLHNQKKNYNVIYFRDDFGFRGRKKVLNDIDFLTVVEAPQMRDI